MTETNTPQTAQFALERIYVKDISYEAPGAPMVFGQQVAPQLNVQLGIEHRQPQPPNGAFEVVLTVTVRALMNDKPIFLVEVQQAGLFRISGMDSDALAHTLEISCAHILLPFARETISDLVTRGGFPQLLINPINFEALYEQRRAQQTQQQTPH